MLLIFPFFVGSVSFAEIVKAAEPAFVAALSQFLYYTIVPPIFVS